MNKELFNQSVRLKTSMCQGLTLLMCAIACIMAVFNLAYHQAVDFALLELSFAAYSLWVYFCSKRNVLSNQQIKRYVIALLLITSLLTYLQPINHGMLIWHLLTPVVLYALLGLKVGRLGSAVMLIVMTGLILLSGLQGINSYSIPIIVNSILCYLGVWFVAHSYESSRYNMEHSLTNLATRDTLTCAYNRLSLNSVFDYFHRNQRPSSSLCLLVIDLDFFKQINDQFGHATGDQVLIETCQVFAEHVGQENVFRIGGEEFCITLFEHSLAQANAIGEALRVRIANYRFSEHLPIQLTLSIGICQYRPGDQLKDLLKLADIELYKAKQNGRNQVCICTYQSLQYGKSHIA